MLIGRIDKAEYVKIRIIFFFRFSLTKNIIAKQETKTNVIPTYRVSIASADRITITINDFNLPFSKNEIRKSI